MSDRRQFLRRAAGGAAVALLTDARALFAEDLDRLDHRLGSLRHPATLTEEYLLGSDVVYLNHASIGTIPRLVHEARRRYLELCETNPWLYMWHDAWQETREEVRSKLAALLRCQPGELAITHNTTEGFNTLAQGLPLRPGDEVLFSSLNHPGASICWRHVGEQRGYRVRSFEFPLTDVPHLTAADVVELYVEQVRPRTRVAVFPHIDNTVGLRHPMKALATALKAKGVEFVAVDGAQSVGMIPVDLGGGVVDFYSGSPHKWLQSPKGLGLLYVSARVRELVRPMWVTWGQTRWQGTARVFEDYGTRNLPELISLGDAIDFQNRLGEQAKYRHHRTTFERMRGAVESDPKLVWRSPRAWDLGAALFAIEVRGLRSTALFERLNRQYGMTFRAFDTPSFSSSRISPNLNTPEEQVGRFLRLATA